ncbi:hypothetical protein WH47_06158 [Habropoda laboriosa]|uniref:Endonuclease/exonuclease/phosphatase domain-containing protein n=1 Tax=Habropoda laboriosa TaxID=597456 RepID=A0A0L7QT67_9HYME|nr:hypothetical protein WH47_06158 [Habropoda laboriosa]
MSVLSDENRGKKRRVNDDCVTDDFEHEELTRVKNVSDKLRRFVLSENNRISKVACEGILGLMSEYEECVMRVIAKNERLEGRLQERQLQERESVRRMNVPECYADVAKRNVGMSDARVNRDGVNARASVRENVSMRENTRARVRESKVAPRKAYAVVVKPVNESVDVTSEEIKKKVLNEVSELLNVRVSALRKTRNVGIAIETVTERERGQLNARGVKTVMDELRQFTHERKIDVLLLQEPHCLRNKPTGIGINAKSITDTKTFSNIKTAHKVSPHGIRARSRALASRGSSLLRGFRWRPAVGGRPLRPPFNAQLRTGTD